MKCANQDGTATGKHHYTGHFKEGKLDGSGKFEHGLTKQSFGPEFSNDHYLHTMQTNKISERRLRNLSPRSFTQATMEAPKVFMDLFNLPSKASQEDFLTKVTTYREDSLRS